MEHRGCSVVHHRDHTKTPHLKKGVVKYRFSKKEKDSTKAYGAKIDSKRSHVLMDLHSGQSSHIVIAVTLLLLHLHVTIVEPSILELLQDTIQSILWQLGCAAQNPNV